MPQVAAPVARPCPAAGDGVVRSAPHEDGQRTVALTFDDGPGDRTVWARVLDKDGGYTDYTFSMTVLNTAPFASLAQVGSAVEGSPATVALSNQRDHSAADAATGFTYNYDFDNDGVFEITGIASASAS